MNKLTSREDCPSGKGCPVHYRVDSAFQDADQRLYGAITYVGEYCVVTGDHPDFIAAVGDPKLMFEIFAAALKGKRTPYYQTLVLWVGEKGCLYDVAATEEMYLDSIVTKNDIYTYEEVDHAHQGMVASVKVFEEL